MKVTKELDGYWWPVMKRTLPDPTGTGVVPYVMSFTMDVVYARYVKFTCLEVYGISCAVSYFAVII